MEKIETYKWENELVHIPLKDRGVSDYQYTFSKGTSPAMRKKAMTGNIWINWAVCLHCKDFIRSMNVHDYKYCSCGKVAVDWGSRYCKRNWNQEDYINVIENFTTLHEE